MSHITRGRKDEEWDALAETERWHKTHASAGNIEKVKELLIDATEKIPVVASQDVITVRRQVTPIPILHNEGKIYLQFCGWSINLYDDGTWCWEDTTGG